MFPWHYFVTAGTLVGQTGPGAGWHLFAAHPELQFDPVTVLAAWLLTRAGGPDSYLLAAVAMMSPGVLVWVALRGTHAAHGMTCGPAYHRAVAILLAPAWTVLALHYAHLDDVLALTFVTLGSVALAHGKGVAASVLFALTTGAKP